MPRAEQTRLGPPVLILEGSYRSLRDLLRAAGRAGATPSRLGWGVAAVCDLLVADLDRRRLLEDDEAEFLVSDLRRWCVGSAEVEATPESISVRIAAWRIVTVRGMTGLESLLAVKTLVAWCIDFAAEPIDLPYGRTWSFIDAMQDASKALVLLGEEEEEARAMVCHAFERGLAEDVPARRDNPSAGPWRLESLAPEPSQPWREVAALWHRADVAPTIEDLRPAEGTVFRVWRAGKPVGLGVAVFDGRSVRVVRAPTLPASGRRRWSGWDEAWMGDGCDAAWMLSACAFAPVWSVVIAACACARAALPFTQTSLAALAAIEAAEEVSRASGARLASAAREAARTADEATRVADGWPRASDGYYAIMSSARAAVSASLASAATPRSLMRNTAETAGEAAWYSAMALAANAARYDPGAVSTDDAKASVAVYVRSCVSLGDVLAGIVRAERRKTPRALL
jgi:hypothetical protein